MAVTVSNYKPTGNTAEYTGTSGVYTIAGTLSADADNKLVSFKGNVTKTADSESIGSFNVYFMKNDTDVQDAVMAALKAIREDIAGKIPPASNS